MSMKNILVFLFLSSAIRAQTGFVISGKITDSNSKKALPGVSIVLQYSKFGTIADENGSFSIKANDSNSVYVFSRIGYEARELNVKQLNKLGFKIALSISTQQLKEVTISADKVQPVVESKMFYVMDYAFLGDDIILLTTREKASGSTLVLTDPSGNVISFITAPEK